MQLAFLKSFRLSTTDADYYYLFCAIVSKWLKSDYTMMRSFALDAGVNVMNKFLCKQEPSQILTGATFICKKQKTSARSHEGCTYERGFVIIIPCTVGCLSTTVFADVRFCR